MPARGHPLVSLACAVLGGACTELSAVELPADPSTRAYVFARLEPLELGAHARTSLSEPRLLDSAPTRVLEYARDLEALALTSDGASAALVVAPSDAPVDEAWSLPPPDRASDLDPTIPSFSAPREEDLEAWRTSFRVERPACKAPPSQPVIEWSHTVHPSFAVPFGEDVLIGDRQSEASDPTVRDVRLYRVRARDLELEPFDHELLPVPPRRDAALTARATVDPAGLIWLAWPVPTSSTGDRQGYSLHTITPTGGVSRGELMRAAEPPGGSNRLGFRISGLLKNERHFIVRADDGDLFARNERTGLWELIFDVGEGPCTNDGIMTLVLDFVGSDELLVGRRDTGEIVRLDLRRPPMDNVVARDALIDERLLCSSARVALAGGLEVLAASRGVEGIDGRLFAWRLGDGPWSRVEAKGINGRSLWGRGDLLIAGGATFSARTFELERRRLDAGPRLCTEFNVPVSSAFYPAQLGEDKLVLGTPDGVAVLTGLPPR